MPAGAGAVVVVPSVVVVPPGTPPVWAAAGTAPASEPMRRTPARPILRFPLMLFDRKPVSFVGLRG